MASEQFSLCWDNFHKNMSSGMQSLLETEDLVDVTLAVEGRYLKAHKMVLSVCSPYFRELFQGNPCKHPIVFMRDVSYVALSDLLHFMYQGEVQVAQENLSTFIKTAEALQIKGLTGDGGVQNESESDQEVEKTATETTTKRTLDVSDSKSSATSRPKKFSGPASKRPKISNTPSVTSSPATSTPVATTGNKYEVASVNTNNVESNNDVDLKMEPNGSGDQTNTEIDDDSQLDQYTDDGTAFEMTDETEDFSLMESGNDEPKPGTSADAGENQDYEVIIDSNEFSKAVPNSGIKKPRSRTRTRFVHGGFVYHSKLIAGKNNKIRYLACAEIKRSGCRARASLPVGLECNFLRLTHPHNHPPNENAEERENLVKHLKEAVRTMPGSLRTVYDTISMLYPKGAEELPFKSVCSSLHRWRRDLSL